MFNFIIWIQILNKLVYFLRRRTLEKHLWASLKLSSLVTEIRTSSIYFFLFDASGCFRFFRSLIALWNFKLRWNLKWNTINLVLGSNKKDSLQSTTNLSFKNLNTADLLELPFFTVNLSLLLQVKFLFQYSDQ